MTTPHPVASANVDDPVSEPDDAVSQSSPLDLPPSLVRLPADLHAGLLQIRTIGRGPFGRRDTQAVFDDHLPTLERVYHAGASHLDVSQVLHDIGITRGDGRPLAVGTVSSAMSRARRAAAPKPDRPSARGRSPSTLLASGPTGTGQRGTALQDRARPPEVAAGVAARPLRATAVTRRPEPLRDHDPLRRGSDRSDVGNRPPHAVTPRIEATISPTAARGPPGDDDNSTSARAAGRLLNRLRNDDDQIQ